MMVMAMMMMKVRVGFLMDSKQFSPVRKKRAWEL